MASLKSLPASERFEEEVRQFCLTGFTTTTLGHDDPEWIDPFVAAGISVFFYERNIYTPVGQKEIDGFLATDRGFFVVECKNVSGNVTGTLNAAWQVGREIILVSGSSHANPITQIKNRIGPLASFLRDRKFPFYMTGLIAFPDEANLSGLSESGTISIHEAPTRDHSYIVTCLSKIPQILGEMPPGVVSSSDAAKVAKLLGLVVPDADSPERLLRFPMGGFDDLSPAQNERILERKCTQALEGAKEHGKEQADTLSGDLESAREILFRSIQVMKRSASPSARTMLLPLFVGLILVGLMIATGYWYYQNKSEVLLIQKKNEEQLLPELIGKDPEASPYALFLLFYRQHPAIPPDKDLLSLAYPLKTREKAKVDPVFRKKFRNRIDEDMKLIGSISRFRVSLSATLVRYDSDKNEFFLTGILPVRVPGGSQDRSGLFPTGQIGVAARLPCPFCDSQILLRDWPLKPSISSRGIFFSFPYPREGVADITAQAPCAGCGLPVHVTLWVTPDAVDAGRTNSGKPFVSLMGAVKVLSIVLDTDGKELYRKTPPSV